ncbi:hypothetical protein P280DRAFT_464842 [Massarina eburnea CBS 473.64]|uniref:Uncharacterized protein n=1 Tax=Massarina eburnea CBS 473.64 TaxID=1395130 RepID=A0A6A6SI66_9PLEO|nr:hypothetical protein P280DRAFT_464842 [Massarina eburnea CBS 473.64]
MGGQVFANIKPDGVNVPRLPTELYQKISQDLTAKLETLFNRVTTPREGPAKLDHGDIDFLVEGIRSKNEADIWFTIKNLLGAELHLPRGGSHSFGIPHPDIPNAYVQVDVELCPGNGTPDSAELFEWTRFMKGDADLLQIIGICHRPLGITCNDRGLHVRVEEIEPYNKKKSQLFLTRDPNEAMRFFGLDSSRYWAGFRDYDDLFNFVSTGRFFAWVVFDHRVEKSNDRSRQSKRAMYRQFVEDYMPAHQEAGVGKTWTRQQVLEEALTMFRKHRQYDEMMEEHRMKEEEEALWKTIRDSLPVEGNSLTSALKALRRRVDFKDGQPFLAATCLDQTPLWTKAIAADSIGATLDWVLHNWQMAKRLEKKRAKETKETAQSSAGA